MQLAVCFHVLRSEWPVWQIMEMENQIQSQEQEVSRLEMVVNESERCVFVVLVLRIQTLVLIFIALIQCSLFISLNRYLYR
jgi:hypothetical protein